MANELVTVLEAPVMLLPDSINGLQNYKLRQHAQAIYKLTNATKRNLFEIAVRLTVIDAERLYEQDGYENVREFANRIFGYKENMTFKLMATAKKFIERDPETKQCFSILAHSDVDYSISQLMEMNTLEADTAKQLDASGVISPDMTTKQIREVVKSYKSGDIDAEGNAIDESGDNDTDGGESEDDSKLIKAAIKALSKLSESATLDADTQAKAEALIAALKA